MGVISVLTPRIDQTRGMRVVARRREGSDRAEITTLAEWLPPLFGAIFGADPLWKATASVRTPTGARATKAMEMPVDGVRRHVVPCGGRR